MSAPVKLVGFAVLLALVFGAAYAFGWAADPGTAEATDDDHSAEHSDHADSETSESGSSDDSLPVAGVLVAQDGYELQLMSGDATAGEPEDLEYRIVGPHGDAVTDFTPTHDKRMHLILVRWDLTGFRHVHPTMTADGTWQIPLTFEEAGDYRMYTDFVPDGRSDPMTLATNVAVSGPFAPAALPQPGNAAAVDDYSVELDGDLVAGESSELTLSISKDGRPVTDLQPYLAAYGHLVALRDGDLAYLHVHPDGEPGDGTTEPGPEITFHVEAPTAGDYRLFLDFKHQGAVRTADFTLQAESSGAEDADAATPDSEDEDHGNEDHDAH